MLLETAPHLVSPLRFLLPIYDWHKRRALMLRTGLALYDALSFGSGLPASGRLDDDDISQLPGLRQKHLSAVLRYHDCFADDARLTLAVLLDARARGADILNRRAVTAIAAARRWLCGRARRARAQAEHRGALRRQCGWPMGGRSRCHDRRGAAAASAQARARQPHRSRHAGPAANRRLHAAGRGGPRHLCHSLARRPLPDRRHHRSAASRRCRRGTLLAGGDGLSAGGL